MIYEWDEEKRERNIEKHGIDFIDIVDFQWETSFIRTDIRHQYGEQRRIAYGFIGIRLCCLVFTERNDAIRIINIRKANKREVRDYEKNKS